VSKRFIISVCILCLLLPLLADGIQGNLEQLLKDDAKKYLQPLANTAGAGLNSGLYNSAKVPFLSLRIGSSMVIIPKDDKTFKTSNPLINDGAPFETATILGGEGKNGYPDGADLPFIPIPNVTATVGLPKKTEFMIRWLPKVDLGEAVGYVDIWGVGLKHSIDQYLPLSDVLPINIALQGTYQSLTVGDIVKIKTQAYYAIADVSIPIVSPYVGVGYEMANLKVDYTPKIEGYEGPKVKIDLDAANKMKMTIGLKLKPFPFVQLYGDYSISESNSINAGLGIEI